MVSELTPPRRPVLSLDDLAAPLTRRPERVHALTAADLAVAFSQGLDLAEGKPAGHAQRVCYIATTLADALGVDPAQRAGVYFGALLHDIGVTVAAADICRSAGVDEEAIFGPSPLRSPEQLRGELPFADVQAVLDAVHMHCVEGATTVRALDLPEEVAEAVLGHHERWDGLGFPDSAEGNSTAIAGRIVAAADLAEGIIAEQSSSLAARRRFEGIFEQHAGTTLDPMIVRATIEAARRDAFWLGLYSDDLAETLGAMKGATDTRKSRKRIIRFAEVFADIADAKGGYTAGHSRRTAEHAVRLAESVGLDAGHVEMVRIAALLHNIGLLGVPARVMSKPDILSVTEMQLMRQHPQYSETILGSLQGFEEIAHWIARHHERPDGKGYPEMLTGDEIPLESRLMSVADVYAALTSPRAHRAALAVEDAKQILLGAGGTQLDPELVRTFASLV